MYIDIKRIELLLPRLAAVSASTAQWRPQADSVSVGADAAFAAIRRIVERYQVNCL